MNKIYELVSLAKQKQEIESDNAFAVRNGFTRAHINNWKSGISSPSALNFMKLCKAAGFETITEALDFIEESEKQRKQAGFASLPMMGVMGAMSLIVVSPTTGGLIAGAFGLAFAARYTLCDTMKICLSRFLTKSKLICIIGFFINSIMRWSVRTLMRIKYLNATSIKS